MRAARAKHSDPGALRRDAHYFAVELARRADALHRLDARAGWDRAGDAVRLVQAKARREIDGDLVRRA